MNTHEWWLLLAVSMPGAVLGAMNLMLALTGERDGLLLPLPRGFHFAAPPHADLRCADLKLQPETLPAAARTMTPAASARPEKAPGQVAWPAFSALRRFWLAGDVAHP